MFLKVWKNLEMFGLYDLLSEKMGYNNTTKVEHCRLRNLKKKAISKWLCSFEKKSVNDCTCLRRCNLQKGSYGNINPLRSKGYKFMVYQPLRMIVSSGC